MTFIRGKFVYVIDDSVDLDAGPAVYDTQAEIGDLDLTEDDEGKIYLARDTGVLFQVVDLALVELNLGTVRLADLTPPAPSKVYSNTSIPAGNTVGDTATETAFDSGYTISADSLAAGDVIRVRARICYALDGASCFIRVKLGSTTVLLCAPADTAAEPAYLSIEADILVLEVGASGSVDAQGSFSGPPTTAAATGNDATIGSIDTTGTLDVTLTVDKDSAASGNDITLRQLVVEILKG